MNANSEANYSVNKAIANMKAVDATYFAKTLNQRLVDHPHQAGSIIKTNAYNADELENQLSTLNWAPFYHPDISEGCSGFVTTQLGGWVGVVDLAVLDELGVGKMVTLDDRKDTGKISCTIIGDQDIMEYVPYTVIITGPEKDKDGNTVEVLYTLHPGEPVSPSIVIREKGMHGKEVSIEEAKSMGLTTAKIVRS